MDIGQLWGCRCRGRTNDAAKHHWHITQATGDRRDITGEARHDRHIRPAAKRYWEQRNMSTKRKQTLDIRIKGTIRASCPINLKGQVWRRKPSRIELRRLCRSKMISVSEIGIAKIAEGSDESGWLLVWRDPMDYYNQPIPDASEMPEYEARTL